MCCLNVSLQGQEALIAKNYQVNRSALLFDSIIPNIVHVSVIKLENVNGTNTLIGCLTILLYDWVNESCDSMQPMKNRVICDVGRVG